MNTSLSITNEHGTYTTSIPETGIPLSDFIDKILIPTLLAAGYSDKTINEHIQGARL